ncbi:hypothetical protein JCM3766R1_000572 [Sporobolomyces carnicolor]
MRSSSTSVTAFALAALASIARAGGIIDNTVEAARLLASASGLNGEGNYVITNVQTGQQLSFSRESGVTNFYPQSGGDSVAIQFAGGAARISGGNNKCASAQWSYDVEGGVDHAVVSYACAVGSGLLTGTDTLEKTKQWFYLVPTGDSGSSDDGAVSADKLNALKSSKAAKVASQQVEDTESSSSSEAASTPASSSSEAPAPASTPAASSSSSSSSSSGDLSLDEQKAKYGYYTTSASSINIKDVDVSGVNKQDKSTWVCRHPGWWLARHSKYVDNHPECASDLAAYMKDHPDSPAARRLARRAAHHDLAEKFSKRGQQSYYIIAVDHILDMSTRAVAGSSVSTFGGYTSTTLSLWNQGDASQMWTITSA